MEYFYIHIFNHDETVLPCHCKDSAFINLEYRHILNGDLRIAWNNELKTNY